MTETAERTALYRVWGEADLLLYIGVSNNFGRRWEQHAKRQPWWGEMKRLTADQWFDSRDEAEDAEEAAIKAEKPKYNKKHVVPSTPRQQKPRRTPAPVAAVKAVTPPVRPVYGSSAPYPYSLLGVRMIEPDMSRFDLATQEGKFAAAKAYYDYEQLIISTRETAERHLSEIKDQMRDPVMRWALPWLMKQRLALETILGNGGELVADDEGRSRIAATVRSAARSLQRLSELQIAMADLYAKEADELDAENEAAA